MRNTLSKLGVNMDGRLVALKGSPFRDDCKQLHKEMLGYGYNAMDLDLLLIDLIHDTILCFIDFKKTGDLITTIEHAGYSHMIRIGIPGYILQADNPSGPFCISRYLGYYWENKKRIPNLDLIITIATWDDIKVWEDELRND